MVGNIAIEGIKRAKPIARIRTAQILVHLPDNATARHDESIVNLANKLHPFLYVVRKMSAKNGKRIKPYGKVMKVLTIAIRRFVDANSTGPAEYAINLCNHPFCLVEISGFFCFGVERDEEDNAKSIRPQIPETIRPDALI